MKNNPVRYKDPTGHWNIEIFHPEYGQIEKGHEILTEETLKRTKEGDRLLYDHRAYRNTLMKIIEGNRSNDDMSDGLIAFVKKHYAGVKQATHAMSEGHQTQRQSVKKIINSIQGFTEKAQNARKRGDIDLENYYLGKALHTIQDSYCPVHTERKDSKDRITKVQVYATQDDHNPNTDSIYKEGYKAKRGTLRPEAKKAILAGVDYLNSYYDAVNSKKTYNINNGFTQKYFEVGDEMSK